MRTVFLIIGLFLAGSAAHLARAQDEARAAWAVRRFDITATVSPTDRALSAQAVLTLQNVGRGAGSTATLHINPKAEIRSIRVDGATATFRAQPEQRDLLQRLSITLPVEESPNATIKLAVDYRLPVADNSGLAAISPLGSQFLPLSYWYPSENTNFSPRGADVAPFRLTVTDPTAGTGRTVIASGTRVSNPAGAGVSYDQPLNGQPFFLSGQWEMAAAASAKNVNAYVPPGASADDRQQVARLLDLAVAARDYYVSLFGAPPDIPVNLVAVSRGAGFNDSGTLLLDVAAFRRPKIDSVAALQIAEAVARLWIGGVDPVRGPGAGVIREGLTRYLATLFIEKQVGRDAADAERLRERITYAGVARRDPPLAVATPLDETYYSSVPNKGAMVWRLVERAMGREAMLKVVAQALSRPPAAGGSSLATLRAALAGQGGQGLGALLDQLLDQPTDMDLMVGLPQQRAGQWVAALRNAGSIDASVNVVATTSTGERLVVPAVIPARNFGEAVFKTTSVVVRTEVDPEKFYPQLDYSNDVAPRAKLSEDALAEGARKLVQQDYAGAEEAARAILANAPLLQEARVLLARALLGEGKLDEAEKLFRALLDDHLPLPLTMARASLGLADISLRRGQAVEAARLYTQAVHIGADYASTVEARAGRIKAESAGNAAPPVDESARAFIAQLDTAIRSGRKAEIDNMLVPGELTAFARGIIGTQPEAWQTRVLRTETVDADRLAADVQITARELGHDQSGTAVLILAKAGTTGWKLAGIDYFEVR